MEDEPAVRDLTQRVLARQGYSVTSASNGEEALACWDAHDGKFDLVLSDVVSPVMGGRALAAGLGQRGADIPMVFMSGYTDSDLPLRGARGEVAPLLAKPFTTDELLTIVRRALDGTT